METQIIQGTLDLMILKVLDAGPLHGWGVAQRIEALSAEVLSVQQGSLYPALRRLERGGWIRARWGRSLNNRRARFYRLTRAGRQRLAAEQAAWGRLAAAVGAVLEGA
jgi:transcriptional regulator